MFNQLAANGLIAGVVVALLAVGFAVLYSGSRFFVFTFGASYTWAAYRVYGAGAGRPSSAVGSDWRGDPGRDRNQGRSGAVHCAITTPTQAGSMER